MSTLSLDQLRELYSNYSPLTSNNLLYRRYIEITGDTYQDKNSIRNKYNKEIFNGFLNETVIKASFVERYCVKRSPRNTITIFELNTGNSRADICMMNGNSIVFEIKTEYDTLSRLNKQMKDYEKSFEYLNVIIPKKSIDSILSNIEDKVGIITYKKYGNKVSFSVFRKPSINTNLDPLFQLNQLTLSDLRELTTSSGSKEVLINNILNEKSKEQINQIFINKTKEKYRTKWEFLLENKNEIEPLDYQWFFKNNISTKIVYK